MSEGIDDVSSLPQQSGFETLVLLFCCSAVLLFRSLPLIGVLSFAVCTGGARAEEAAALFRHNRAASVASDSDGLPDSRALRRSRLVFDPGVLAPPPFMRDLLARKLSKSVPDVSIAVGQALEMELFPGENMLFMVRRAEVGLDGVVTWIAKAVDDDFGETLISRKDGYLFATVHKDGRIFQVRDGRNGQVFAEELDPTAFPAGNDDVVHALGDSDKSASGTQKSQGAGGSRTVDVAVLYTQAVAQRQNIPVFVNNAAAEMNQSFINSGVDGSVRVVYYGLSSFVEPDDPPEMMDYTAFYQAVTGMYYGVSEFSDLHGLRDDLRGDVVLLLTDASKATDVCGLGYVPLSVSGSPNRAYALTGDTCVTATRTFTHEIGHNIGAFHDKSLEEFEEDLLLSYSYGHSSVSPDFRTIMGSLPLTSCNMAGCPRINYWSTPNLMHQGIPIGHAADADMARSHNEWIQVPAAYRTSGDPPPGMPSTVDVEPSYCYGINLIMLGAGSGTVGWYEVQQSASSSFSSPQEVFRGPQQPFTINVFGGSKWIRARACNSEGCSGWKAGDEPAIRTNCDPYDL